MIVKIRSNQDIRSDLDALRIRFCGIEARIAAGYVIGLAVKECPNITESDWKLAVANLEQSNSEEYSTSINLQKEVYNQLVEIQGDLERKFGRSFRFPEVIQVVLHAVIRLLKAKEDISEAVAEEATAIIDIINNLTADIDYLVFKQEYEGSLSPQKELLYTIVREYLEKNEPLNRKLRESTTRWVRSLSDYYNSERYTPPRSKRLGTANIVFIAKAVAGFALAISEIENIPIDTIIYAIRSEISSLL